MKNRLFIKNKDYCYYLIAIAICLLLWFFEKYVTEAFFKASEFFSKCEETPWAIIIILLALLLSVYCLYKVFGKNKEFVSHKQTAMLLVIAIVYVYYRVRKDAPFGFWGFELGGYSIAWTDLLLLPLALRLIQAFVYQTPTMANESTQALLSDKSIGSAEEDLLGYNNYVKDLLSDINTLDLSESYSIGITGDWGQGKSSFLNLLKREVEKQNDLCLVFSPRNSKNVSTIQDDFFNQLNKTLRKHHTNLGYSFQRYKKALSIINTGWLGKVFSFIDALDVEDEKKAINHGIQRIGKRLFIIIEDFDRLTVEEILEVLKVIDRNGDFNNTVYLTAYDKRYINSVLSKHFGNEGVQDYSDKYFQHEYSLPAQQSAVIIDFIFKYLKEALKIQGGIVEANFIQFLKTNERIIAECLPSLRHAKRFLNIFCSRYPKIRQDVYFSDFFLLTLLRYVDIQTYYALARLEIVSPGSFLNYQNKSYTLMEKMIDSDDKKVKKPIKELLVKMFPNKTNSTNPNQFVNRICWIDSFDLYFYDYCPGRVYYKELFQLFSDPSETNAFQKMDEELEKGQATYIEDFLCSRRVDEVNNTYLLSRWIKLLCYMDHRLGRSATLELKIGSFLEVQSAKEYALIFTNEEYKQIVETALRESLSFAPSELGFMFIQEIDSINEDKIYSNALVFTRDELVGLAVWAQKYYYQIYDNPDFNYGIAFVLANIKTKQILLTKVVDPAKQELVSMMRLHPLDFATNVVVHRMINNNRGKFLQLSFNENFLADQYFPVDGFNFNDWVALLPDEHARFVLKTIHNRYMDGKKAIQVEALQDDYKQGDFNAFYEAITKDSVRQLDASVKQAVEEGSVYDLSCLKERIRAGEDEIKASLSRLIEEKAIDPKYLFLKDHIAPFDEGDFVQINWKVYASINKEFPLGTNLFTIIKIHDDDQYELSGWHRMFSKQELRPVFIDDEVSQQIYYDPVVAAPTVGPGQSSPARQTDYRYFMKHFENCLDFDDVSFKQRVDEKGFLYVHEVQHWLREEFGSDDLKYEPADVEK